MQFIRQQQQILMSARCCSNMSIFLWSCGNKAPARSCEKEDFWFLKTTLKKKNKTKSSYWWDAWTDTTRDSVSSWLLTCNGGENKTPQWCCWCSCWEHVTHMWGNTGQLTTVVLYNYTDANLWFGSRCAESTRVCEDLSTPPCCGQITVRRQREWVFMCRFLLTDACFRPRRWQ